MSKLLGNLKRGLLFIISSPSGAGKTTLIQKLCDEIPLCEKSISCTTRTKRLHEIEGKDYYFLTKEEFQSKEQAGEFLESARVFDHNYGTLKKDIDNALGRGKHLFLVIDTQGALYLKDKIDAIYIFIQPPSLEELKRRLLKRGGESDASVELRLSWAKEEIDKSRFYDYQVVNDDLNLAYETLKSILVAEEHKTANLGAF